MQPPYIVADVSIFIIFKKNEKRGFTLKANYGILYK